MLTNDELVVRASLITKQSRKLIKEIRRSSVRPQVEQSRRLIKESRSYIERTRLLQERLW